jgi:hypothetical protein
MGYNFYMKVNFRPDLTEYSGVADEIVARLNSDSWSHLSKTDVVKIALERFYKDAFPGKTLPRMKRKYFILCNF